MPLAGFTSERWPASNRNTGRHQIGIPGRLASEFAIGDNDVEPGRLTVHADRGGPMKAKATAFLLADLGITKSHSRPHNSNDNPFSESHFKTLKYQPEFPKSFGCIEDARAFCRRFFDWYNQSHHHAGIGLMTPD
jgi:transposase InsO family protein